VGPEAAHWCLNAREATSEAASGIPAHWAASKAASIGLNCVC